MFRPVDEQLSILLRGAAQVETEKELRAKLERSFKTNTPLRVKYGIDPTGVGRPLGLTEMGELKMQLAAEAAADRAPPAATPGPRSSLPGAIFAGLFIRPAAAQTALPAVAARTDETIITLRPNQGIEVKLDMRSGARVNFNWTATGPVNYDMHGEPPTAGRNSTYSYRNGRGSSGEQGPDTGSVPSRGGMM